MGSEERAPNLEVGMILLDPDNCGRPSLWTVKSKTKLIAHMGDCIVEATMRSGKLPKGWRIVNNRPAAKRFSDILSLPPEDEQ